LLGLRLSISLLTLENMQLSTKGNRQLQFTRNLSITPSTMAVAEMVVSENLPQSPWRKTASDLRLKCVMSRKETKLSLPMELSPLSLASSASPEPRASVLSLEA